MKRSATKNNINGIKLINIASLSGILGEPTNSDYAMSKFAIEGLTHSIALELPENIMICNYDPGSVATSILEDFSGNNKQVCIINGSIDETKWGQLNYNFMVNKLNRKDHNGKHVWGIQSRESYTKQFGQRFPFLPTFIRHFDAFQAKL